MGVARCVTECDRGKECQNWSNVLYGRPPASDFRGGRGVAEGSWTGRETLLYLIMYRKYVRKW